MNIMTKAKKSDPAPLLPEQIRQRLAELSAEALALDKAQGELAELSINDAAVERRYNENIAAGARVAAEISRFEQALAAMEARAEQQKDAEQAAVAGSHRNRVVAMLAERVAAARQFEHAIGEAIAGARKIAEISHRAFMAWPGTQPDPRALALGEAAVSHLIAAEMFRQGGAPTITGGASHQGPLPLPAPRCPSFDLVDHPQDTPSLVTAIEEANGLARQYLEGRPQ